MVATVETVAFEGIEARRVEVQVLIASGLPSFTIVGLPDKAVTEARERVRAALSALGLSLPPKRITVNLSPADRPKEGSHYDLPIATALLVAMNVLPADSLADTVVAKLTEDEKPEPSLSNAGAEYENNWVYPASKLMAGRHELSLEFNNSLGPS